MAGQLANVPESSVLPKCDVLCRVAAVKRGKTQTEKLMYKAEFRIVDSGDGRFKNLPIFETYTIGSDTDPEAENNKTWMEAPGARNMKRLFKKLGLDTTKDVDALCEEAEDMEIGLSINRQIEPDKIRRAGKEIDNPYAGQPRNRIAGYWTPGEKSPNVHEEIDEDGEATEAAPAKSAAKSAKPAAKVAAAPAPTADEDEPAPRKTKAPAPNGGNESEARPAAKAEAKAEKMLACPEDGCDAVVPKSKFLEHAATHAE